MNSSLPLDGARVFLHIRDSVTSRQDGSSSPRMYRVAGARQSSGRAEAVRKRTRRLVKELGATLCLSENAADIVLCYNAMPSYLREVTRDEKLLVLDPAYVEACLDANARVDPEPFKFVCVARVEEEVGQGTATGTKRVVGTGSRTSLHEPAPLTGARAPAGHSRSASGKTPVRHVSRAVFAFDTETTPHSRRADTSSVQSSSPRSAPRSPVTPLAPMTSTSAQATPPLPVSGVLTSPADGTSSSLRMLAGVASTSTTTLTPPTQCSRSTPPCAVAAPLPPSMEEVRHAVLRASACLPEGDAAARSQKRRRRSDEVGDDDPVRASTGASTRRSRADPFLLATEEHTGDGVSSALSAHPGTQQEARSRTPTPQITQRLASSSSCPPSQAIPKSVAVPTTHEPVVTALDASTVSQTSDATLLAPHLPSRSGKRATAAATSARPKVATVSLARITKKGTPSAAEVKGPEAVHPLQPEPTPAVPVLPLPAGLQPMPLYDAAGHYHPRKSLRIGVVQDPSLHASTLSLWSDVVEQLGARLVDRSTSATLLRRHQPNILIAPAQCEVTVDVLMAKALGIRIVLPQWLDDAILLGDFPEVLPHRHTHPLFGTEAESDAHGATKTPSPPPSPAASGVDGPGDGAWLHAAVSTAAVLGDLSHDDLGGSPTSPRTPPTAPVAPVGSSCRRPRATEVQFLRRTTAEEFLPVGEQWERPYYQPIFRDMMFYLRPAEEIGESPRAPADGGRRTTASNKARAKATQDAVVTLEQVAYLIRTLGGTVCRNLASANLDVVLDLVLDFGQLAAQVGGQAVALGAGGDGGDAVEAGPASRGATAAAAAGGCLSAPCASLSLIYQHTLTYMETYSQRPPTAASLPLPHGHRARAESGRDGTDCARPVEHKRCERGSDGGDGAVSGGAATSEDHPGLPVVGLPWLVYSVLTRQCADLALFASSRPSPPRTCPSARRSREAGTKRRVREGTVAAEATDVEQGEPKAPATPPQAGCGHGEATPSVDTFLRSFVSPAVKTRASGDSDALSYALRGDSAR